MNKDSNKANNKLIKFNLNLNLNNPIHSDNNSSSQPKNFRSNKNIFNERFKEKNNKYIKENESMTNLKDFTKNLAIIEKKYKDINMINLLNKNNNTEYKNKYKSIIRNNNRNLTGNNNSSFSSEFCKNWNKTKTKKESFYKKKNILTYNLLFDPDLLGYKNTLEKKEKNGNNDMGEEKYKDSMLMSSVKTGKNMYVFKTMELKNRYDRSKGIKTCLFDSIKYCDF